MTLPRRHVLKEMPKSVARRIAWEAAHVAEAVGEEKEEEMSAFTVEADVLVGMTFQAKDRASATRSFKRRLKEMDGRFFETTSPTVGLQLYGDSPRNIRTRRQEKWRGGA